MESQKLREQEAAEIASGRAPRKRADHGTRVHVSKEDRKKAEAARRILDQQTSAEYSIAFEQLEEEYDDAFHDRGDARAEWLAKATMVVDAFRETRVLFPSDKFKKYVGPLGRNWKRKGAANDLATDVDELTKRLERSQGSFRSHFSFRKSEFVFSQRKSRRISRPIRTVGSPSSVGSRSCARSVYPCSSHVRG